MSNFSLTGEPEFWGTRLVWSATLAPGAFEMAAAGSTTDTIDVWKMTAQDAAGLHVSSEPVIVGMTRELPHDVMPGDSYESSADLDLRLRGTAVLAGRVNASLAITGGVHTALDVVKSTMAGAHVVQIVSALMRNGPSHLRGLQTELEAWMLANEWNSLEEMRGNMSFQKIPNPAVYERENFRRMFQ